MRTATAVLIAIVALLSSCDAEETSPFDESGAAIEASDGDEDVDFRAIPFPGYFNGASCHYHRNSTTGALGFSNCLTDESAISGGCYQSGTSSSLISSNPYEQGSETDLPEDGASLTSLGGFNGWACRRAASTSGTLHTLALCCDSVDPPGS